MTLPIDLPPPPEPALPIWSMDRTAVQEGQSHRKAFKRQAFRSSGGNPDFTPDVDYDPQAPNGGPLLCQPAARRHCCTADFPFMRTVIVAATVAADALRLFIRFARVVGAEYGCFHEIGPLIDPIQV